jgi:hypothetical protein
VFETSFTHIEDKLGNRCVRDEARFALAFVLWSSPICEVKNMVYSIDLLRREGSLIFSVAFLLFVTLYEFFEVTLTNLHLLKNNTL